MTESELREKWLSLWHEHKDRNLSDMLLELLCAVLYPKADSKKEDENA